MKTSQAPRSRWGQKAAFLRAGEALVVVTGTELQEDDWEHFSACTAQLPAFTATEWVSNACSAGSPLVVSVSFSVRRRKMEAIFRTAESFS